MKETEDDIRDFFSEMRKSDGQVAVPEFEELYKPKRWQGKQFVLVGVAAMLLLFIGAFFLSERKFGQTEVLIVVTTEKTGTQSLITEESANAWKSPTDGLIDDFYE